MCRPRAVRQVPPSRLVSLGGIAGEHRERDVGVVGEVEGSIPVGGMVQLQRPQVARAPHRVRHDRYRAREGVGFGDAARSTERGGERS